MDSNTDFWAFSLALYGNSEVAAGCLHWQDTWQARVNIVLWVCWLGRHGYAVDNETLIEAERCTDKWHKEVVQPLRTLRRHIKTQFGSSNELVAETRERISRAELKAEQREQSLLAGLRDQLDLQGDSGALMNNLHHYATRCGISEQDRQPLLTAVTRVLRTN